MKGRAFLHWSGHGHATTRAQRPFRATTLTTDLLLLLLILLQEIVLLPHLLVNKKLKVLSILRSLFTLSLLYYLLLKKFRCMESLTPLQTGAEHFVFFII